MNVHGMKDDRLSDDAFAVLGLPRSFEIDPRALQAAYLRRAAALHPDRIADPFQREEAQRSAAALNDARALLADDEQRANLLLRLAGGPAKEEDQSLPEGFLIEMMDIRQELEAALARGDEAERARLETWARNRREQHIATVRNLFAALGDNPTREGLAAIRRELNAWRYIERMLEQSHD